MTQTQTNEFLDYLRKRVNVNKYTNLQNSKSNTPVPNLFGELRSDSVKLSNKFEKEETAAKILRSFVGKHSHEILNWLKKINGLDNFITFYPKLRTKYGTLIDISPIYFQTIWTTFMREMGPLGPSGAFGITPVPVKSFGKAREIEAERLYSPDAVVTAMEEEKGVSPKVAKDVYELEEYQKYLRDRYPTYGMEQREIRGNFGPIRGANESRIAQAKNEYQLNKYLQELDQERKLEEQMRSREAEELKSQESNLKNIIRGQILQRIEPEVSIPFEYTPPVEEIKENANAANTILERIIGEATAQLTPQEILAEAKETVAAGHARPSAQPSQPETAEERSARKVTEYIDKLSKGPVDIVTERLIASYLNVPEAEMSYLLQTPEGRQNIINHLNGSDISQIVNIYQPRPIDMDLLNYYASRIPRGELSNLDVFELSEMLNTAPNVVEQSMGNDRGRKDLIEAIERYGISHGLIKPVAKIESKEIAPAPKIVHKVPEYTANKLITKLINNESISDAEKQYISEMTGHDIGKIEQTIVEPEGRVDISKDIDAWIKKNYPIRVEPKEASPLGSPTHSPTASTSTVSTGMQVLMDFYRDEVPKPIDGDREPKKYKTKVISVLGKLSDPDVLNTISRDEAKEQLSKLDVYFPEYGDGSRGGIKERTRAKLLLEYRLAGRPLREEAINRITGANMSNLREELQQLTRESVGLEFGDPFKR